MCLATISLVGPVLLVLFSMRMLGFHLGDSEAMDYAQLGRNLLSGHGFVTHILRPLALTHGHDPFNQPDVTRGPLYPFLLALSFGAFGAKDTVVMALSGLFYLMTIPVVYCLGRQVFDQNVGRLSAVVFALSAPIVQEAGSGSPSSLFVLLMTSLFLALHTAATRRSRGTGLLIGGLGGLLYLADPVFFWILPGVFGALFLLPGRDRSALVPGSGLAMGALVLPWMIRNARVTGNPLFGLRAAELWMDTSRYPGYHAYMMAPSGVQLGRDLVHGVFLKVLANGEKGVMALSQLPAIWLLAFFIPSLFFSFSVPATLYLRRVVLVYLGLIWVGSALFVFLPIRLLTVWPALIVFASAHLLYVIQQARLPRSSQVLASLLLGGVLVMPLVDAAVLGHVAPPTQEAILARSLRRPMKARDACLSDAPWLVAWYTDRPAIWLPENDEDISTLRKDFAGIRWLFLTRQSRSLSQNWQMVFTGLAQWNLRMAQVQPDQVTAEPRLPNPLLQALEGFTVVPTSADANPVAVVAVVP
jgi:4-amino-4-deoxy-L-arabinose transferase-like glycosyltransferase